MKLVFFGHSAWGVQVGATKVLIDPYPDSARARREIEQFAADASLVLVSHGAFDHLGIAFELMEHHEHLRLVTEPAVFRTASTRLPPERLEILVWNGEKELDGVSVRAVEVRHVSAFEAADGAYLTGMPLGFLIHGVEEPHTRLLHLGDTSIFSDLALFGQLYKPTVALVGIGAAKGLFSEMSPSEGALAALWLGVDVALPMHFEDDPGPAHAFCEAVAHMPRAIRSWVPEPFEAVEILSSLTVNGEPPTSAESGHRRPRP